MRLGNRTERVARRVIAAEESAEGIVGGSVRRRPERLEWPVERRSRASHAAEESGRLYLGPGTRGEAPSTAAQETEARAARTDIDSRAALVGPSMEAIVEPANLTKALAQVKRNKGAPGIDGMRVDDLAAYLKEHWPTIRAQLFDGTYKPQPVRRGGEPKGAGGTPRPRLPTGLHPL